MGYSEIMEQITVLKRAAQEMDDACSSIAQRYGGMSTAEIGSLREKLVAFGMPERDAKRTVDNIADARVVFGRSFGLTCGHLDMLEANLHAAESDVEMTKHNLQRDGIRVAP